MADVAAFVAVGETPSDLEETMLDMLLEVDRICQANGIPYFLIGGTLLGAVRHGGFIPWDDDVDIAMNRDDYERFCVVCTRELDTDKYFLQNHLTDPSYRWGYTRIRRNNSEFVRVGQEHLKMKTGIFLDIFINDNVPDIYPLRVLHALFCYLCRKILYAEVGALTAESLWQRGMYRALSLIPASGVFHLLALVSKHLNSRRKSFVRAVTFPTHNRGFGAPRAWFEATTPMLFEGYELPVPIGYREYLVSKYGSDYLTPPPPEQRHRHPVSEFRLPPD